MESHRDQPESSGFLVSALKLLIMVVSLGVASIVGFYLHPHLLPILTVSIPKLCGAAQGWLTAPVLFLLFNIVVGTLYLSSGMLSRSSEKDKLPHPRTPPTIRPPTDVARNSADSSVPDSIARDSASTPEAPNSLRSSSGGLRARIERSKPFTRLVRSKSEQIAPLMKKAEASGSKLKKAGTFEAAAQGGGKPMVVVADLPEEEEGAGQEEVDKKAEDFISRFYQKVKLQRLDSLLRYQQTLQQGPPT